MSTIGEPGANQPPPLFQGVLVFLALAGMLAVVLSVIVGFGWVGHTITGKLSGAVAGGGIGLVIFFVVKGVVFGESRIEVGCLVVMFVMLIALVYPAMRAVEKKVEEERSRKAATALTTADR